MGLQKLRLLKGTDCDVRTETTPHVLNGRVWKNGSRSRHILDCWSRRMATYLPTTRAIAATTTASELATARCGGLTVAEHQEAEDAYHRVVGLIAGAGTRILSPT